MKYIIIFIVALTVGIGIGWYFGYSSQTTKHRVLVKKYQRLEDVKNKEDWLLWLFATKSLEEVENAGTNQPEQVALLTIYEYYYELRRDQYNGWDVGNTNLIAQIEAASLKYPVIQLGIKK
jgi:uncharacterized protein YxeA